MELIWQEALAAGQHSSFHALVQASDTAETARTLVLRPLRRFEDSLAARIAPWNRWKRWVAQQPVTVPEAVYAPNEFILGQYFLYLTQFGPTSAPTAWHSLRWWSRRLGLNFPFDSALVVDFRYAEVGHRVEAAKPLDLEVLPELARMA